MKTRFLVFSLCLAMLVATSRPAMAYCDTSHCDDEAARCEDDARATSIVYNLVSVLVCAGAGFATGPLGGGVGGGCAWMAVLVGQVIDLEMAADCDAAQSECEEEAELDCESDEI